MKLLRIKPLKPFFFGGDINLGRYYYAKSEYFPQNTQIVGALRFFIANQKKLMRGYKNGIYVNKKDREKAVSLIGDANGENFFENDNLGKINFVSPMFILSGNNAFFPTPFDLKQIDEDIYLTYKLKKISDTFYLEGFDYKKIVFQKLGGKSFWEKYVNGMEISKSDFLEFNEVYKEVSQVGISLENKRVIDEKFYSKTSFELKKGYEFGVVIDFEDDIEDGFIQIGADGSMFELKVCDINEELKSHPVIEAMLNQKNDGHKFVAISEVIEKQKIDTDFRVSPVYKTLRFNLYKNKRFKKTKEFNVAARGSVFYADRIKYFDLGAFKKMGYNLFISVKEK